MLDLSKLQLEIPHSLGNEAIELLCEIAPDVAELLCRAALAQRYGDALREIAERSPSTARTIARKALGGD